MITNERVDSLFCTVFLYSFRIEEFHKTIQTYNFKTLERIKKLFLFLCNTNNTLKFRFDIVFSRYLRSEKSNRVNWI